MTGRTQDVDLICIAAAQQVEEVLEQTPDGDAALRVTVAAVDVLAEVLETRGYIAVTDGLAAAVIRRPYGVSVLLSQALTELNIARNGGGAA